MPLLLLMSFALANESAGHDSNPDQIERPAKSATEAAEPAPKVTDETVETVIQPEIPQINPEPSTEKTEPVPPAPEPATIDPDATLYLDAEEYLEVQNQEPLEILDQIVQPGEKRELSWSAGQSFSGRSIDPPVLVVRGTRSGPSLCLVAAIHGDELNGIEIVRRVIAGLEPENVSGTVIGVPIVNIYGFTNGSRYLPDRRDLNRYFPGKNHGSSASRIAYLFFNQIIKHCNMLVDFHTGSFKRSNMPQLRADLNDPAVMEFTRHFGATAVLHKAGVSGNLRTAATRAGIPAVTFELGQPGFLQTEDVEFGVKAIETLIGKLGLLKRYYLWFKPQPIYYGSRWIRANQGGILRTATRIGAVIKENELLGHIINPLTNEETEILSPVNGRVLGMALNQFMLPGYAAFHIGIATRDPKLTAGFQLLHSAQPGETIVSDDMIEDPAEDSSEENEYPDTVDDEESN